MYLCYIDESGTSSVPGNSSHFVLAGISIPIWHWKTCDKAINSIKKRYDIEHAEIHTGWIIRPYLEQSKIPNFEQLSRSQRRSEVGRYRRAELLRLQKSTNRAHYKQTKKNFLKTESYVHLTFEERKKLVSDIATCVSSWGYARLFAECIDKVHFDPARTSYNLDEQTLDQVVSRFERYLDQMGGTESKAYGLIIHDNNETIEKKHTELMKHFHKNGTLWTNIKNIIETPLFVDSQLTSMVQIADLCSYALRRYLENNESELFDLVFTRADRKGVATVGVRHFTNKNCVCKICSNHSYKAIAIDIK